MDGFERKTMHDLTCFFLKICCCIKKSRMPNTEVESLVNDKGKLTVAWTRVLAEEAVRSGQWLDTDTRTR